MDSSLSCLILDKLTCYPIYLFSPPALFMAPGYGQLNVPLSLTLLHLSIPVCGWRPSHSTYAS